ncbi:MAG: TonB-dependent receptor [Cyclobacteriaceae bacterium]|nr:TonB-dependent receptor [Cyclobacteriaceae bacterium]
MLKVSKLILVFWLISTQGIAQSDVTDSIRFKQLEEIVISATRAGVNTPVSYQNIKKAEIEKRNLGQDVPFLLAPSPSLVFTSDAGMGIGYTSMRIRGSDATRINVTINGVPYNDSESQGTFWVNMPDFSTSVNSIQIQRGVGTSTNGSGAFGASVNMETSLSSQDAFVELNNSFGSFGSRKHNIILNSGLLDGKWSFEGKLAQIASDGYIDRATSDLGSYYLSGNYIGKNTVVKALMFGGQEETYQAWNGIEAGQMQNDRTFNSAGMYTDEEGQVQFYDKEVDHYNQDHFQLHLNQRLGQYWNFNVALHYTKGKGYFEQYKEDQAFGDYGLPTIALGNETIEETDLVRRRWLDNDFYGFIYGLNFDRERTNLVIGGGYNEYEGDHFGEIIWAQYASTGQIRHKYYDNVGKKKDFNTYVKLNYTLTPELHLFGDMQIRTVDYHTEGIDNDQRNIDVGNDYVFFNPKLGASYSLGAGSSVFASYAVGNREPDRNDFIDSPVLPKHESLGDLEVGYTLSGSFYSIGANFYYMNYINQLVLTGALNDVGSSIRTNVPDSYRRGIELTAALKYKDKINWNGNVTYSDNKIKRYEEDLNDYLEGGLVSQVYEDTDIAYSPSWIASSQLTYSPATGLDVTLFSKFVGKQYLDNTSNDSRKLDAYFINDIIINYAFSSRFIEEIGVNLMVNNIFDVKYQSNGYAFGYYYGEEIRETYYYPQAGINLMAGLSLRF